ncbi:hypothetical protein TNCV_2879741 [Trichonephila clavipes]|uniref:Transmembrane protein n=1 Tax=Trichonephila clavipes TaxID=2585209 RepID=A0A8X6W2E0_TRICX|nr:hypothetical protein TNCV_2879741 [Trichonephila clavipes]
MALSAVSRLQLMGGYKAVLCSGYAPHHFYTSRLVGNCDKRVDSSSLDFRDKQRYIKQSTIEVYKTAVQHKLLCSEPKLFFFRDLKRPKWARHPAKLNEDCCCKKILLAKLMGNRPRADPVKMDLKVNNYVLITSVVALIYVPFGLGFTFDSSVPTGLG